MAESPAAQEDKGAWLVLNEPPEQIDIEEILDDIGSFPFLGSEPPPDEHTLVEEAEKFNRDEELNHWQEAESQARLLEEAELQFVDEEDLYADLFAMDHGNVECTLLLKALEEGSHLVDSGVVVESATSDQLMAIKRSAQRLLNTLDCRILSTVERERNEARNAADMACRKTVRVEAQAAAMHKALKDEIASASEREAKTRELLEKEEARTTCQICFSRVRDILLLPCMHFLYCQICLLEHRRRKNNCPTCRSPITGLLHCTLGIS